jgi:hypothetical protein
LPQVFAWAREANPSQPLTSGVWTHDDWGTKDKLNAIEQVQLGQSDIVTFHVYDWPEVFERRVKQLQAYGRPDDLYRIPGARAGSTFDTSLPLRSAGKLRPA